MAETKPWLRQRGETHKAYEAFKIYCELGSGRSQRLVAERLGKSEQICSRWSARWSWVERSRQYDNELVRQDIEQARKGIAEMRQRQITTGTYLQAKALAALKEKADSDKGLSREELKDLLNLITKGAEMEEHARTEGLYTLTGAGADADDLLARAKEILGGIDSVIK